MTIDVNTYNRMRRLHSAKSPRSWVLVAVRSLITARGKGFLANAIASGSGLKATKQASFGLLEAHYAFEAIFRNAASGWEKGGAEISCPSFVTPCLCHNLRWQASRSYRR